VGDPARAQVARRSRHLWRRGGDGERDCGAAGAVGCLRPSGRRFGHARERVRL